MQNRKAQIQDQSLVMLEGLGARIKFIRRTCNLSQNALAEALGVVQQTVSAWERGWTLPSVGMLCAFCKASGVSADTVLGLNEISAGIDTAQALLKEVGA